MHHIALLSNYISRRRIMQLTLWHAFNMKRRPYCLTAQFSTPASFYNIEWRHFIHRRLRFIHRRLIKSRWILLRDLWEIYSSTPRIEYTHHTWRQCQAIPFTYPTVTPKLEWWDSIMVYREPPCSSMSIIQTAWNSSRRTISFVAKTSWIGTCTRSLSIAHAFVNSRIRWSRKQLSFRGSMILYLQVNRESDSSCHFRSVAMIVLQNLAMRSRVCCFPCLAQSSYYCEISFRGSPKIISRCIFAMRGW